MAKPEIVAYSVSAEYKERAKQSGADHYLVKASAESHDWLKNQAGRTVLYIDDDPESVTIVTKYLEIFGTMAHGCTDPELALDQVQKLKPDIILIDIHLGTVNGTELIRSIRSLSSPSPQHSPF
jgi:PleD family two-component response regulator